MDQQKRIHLEYITGMDENGNIKILTIYPRKVIKSTKKCGVFSRSIMFVWDYISVSTSFGIMGSHEIDGYSSFTLKTR